MLPGSQVQLRHGLLLRLYAESIVSPISVFCEVVFGEGRCYWLDSLVSQSSRHCPLRTILLVPPTERYPTVVVFS